MKGFKKLALVSAVAALPMSGFAMEALDDTTLSGVTGQDGIVISLGNDISADIVIHDKDGFTGATEAGAIVITGFQQTLGGGSIDIEIDAGHDGVDGAALNIAVSLPATMTLDLGTVSVAESNRPAAWGYTNPVQIMTLGTLSLGATDLNIQLGHEYQGAMIVMDTTISGGISLAGFSITDASSSESISLDLALVGSGVVGGDLVVDQTIDVEAGGLVINVLQLGDAVNGADLRLSNVTLGSTPSLGDIEIQRLDLTGTITISGK